MKYDTFVSYSRSDQALGKLGLQTRGAKRFDSAQDLFSTLSTEQKQFAGLALRAVETSDFDPHFTLPSIVFGPND